MTSFPKKHELCDQQVLNYKHKCIEVKTLKVDLLTHLLINDIIQVHIIVIIMEKKLREIQ